MDTIIDFLSDLVERAPGQEFSYYIPMAVLAGVMIAGGIAFSHVYKQKRKQDFAFKRLFRKVSTRMVLLGVLFIFLALVRYENIPYFSMRLWIYIALILFAYAIYYYVRIYRKVYPIEKENAKIKSHTQSNKKTYLPNKKRR